MPLSRITSLFQSATANVYSPSANTVAIRTSSADRFTVTSAGDVGIGTSSPAVKLDVAGNATIQNGFLTVGKDTLYDAFINTPESMYFNVDSDGNSTGNFFVWGTDRTGNSGGTEWMRLNSSGNLDLSSGNLSFSTSGSSKLSIFKSASSFAYTGPLIFSYDAAGLGIGANGAAPIVFGINNTERMRLDASGILLVGTTSASASLAAGGLQVTDRICVGTGSVGTPSLHASGDTNTGLYFPGADIVGFATGGTERARITSDGDWLVGTTNNNPSGNNVAGFAVASSGLTRITVDGSDVLRINRRTNDGTLQELRQEGVTEGIISVSGTTVTYGGGHLARFAQLPDGSKDETMLKGTVLTNLDEMCVWINKETGEPADNEQCNKVKVSEVEGDASVAGVFVSWTYDDQHDTNDLFVAMTGDMIIRIAQGVTVQKGDLLMSAGDGTAKPQGDDIVRSKTIAKVTSNHVTCTYDDGSYCVPCVLMAC